MPSDDQFHVKVHAAAGERPGASAVFPFDRSTVERFRIAFPRARWNDDRCAWFVPGVTAERRLRRWLDQELSKIQPYADERGKDAFAFDPIVSPYLEADEDLLIRTSYSRTVVNELHAVPWARWDQGARAWRVPYRSWEELRRRWPAIEAAARRHKPEARWNSTPSGKDPGAYKDAAAKVLERRRHRYPVRSDAPPPLDRVVMTNIGAVVFTEITGACAEKNVVERYYPSLSEATGALVWARWRRPTHAELVKAWPSRQQHADAEHDQGWRNGTLEDLRLERRKARSIEQGLSTRQRLRTGGQ